MRRYLFVVLALALSSVAHAQNPFGGLHWRLLGPFRGGRALAVCGVPGQPEKFYFGSVGGGVWLSNNAGRTWAPIFDKESAASIGAIAVAPSDHNVVYVGSGEADMRSDIQQGDGMYKSTDAGKTWTHIGLEDTRQIGKILIDPRDPNTVYVAALGHQYGPNEQRGVFKTTDGGKTWDKVLYKDENTGAIDMDMDPTDSRVIYASMWQTRRPPWSVYPPSMGPGSGLYKSTDAGHSWSQIKGHGFPSFVGRVGVCVSPVDHNRVYVCLDTDDQKVGGVYSSEDAGETWTHTNIESRVWGRGWYFCGITADPRDVDGVYVMNTSAYHSTDSGKTFTAFKGAPGGDDYHTCWVEPDDPNRMILGTDQGVVVTVDGAKTWSSWYNQPTGQFYHIITDNRFPYWVYGSQQDSGGMAVPSRTIHTGVSALYQRPVDAGGESGTVAPDPLHPGLLYSTGGSKEDFDTAWEQDVDPTLARTDEVWRNEWTMPITISEADPHALYLSHQKIFATKDGGNNWKVISPDLTRKKHTIPGNLDPVTAKDDEGLPRMAVVYWIAPSPIHPKQLWAGTDDGLIWLTRDDGKHWEDVTPPELTPWSKVGIIDSSHFDGESAYAAIDRHRLDDNHPYIYRTHDGGKHWKLITQGIPQSQFVNVVREDPKAKGLLYAGTDWGVYVSIDDGDHWRSLQLNLPAASIRDIVFGGNDVVVGTHGRAIWALDDVVPLRQMASVKPGANHFFKPSPAMLFQRAGTFGFGAFDEGTPLPAEEPQGENPAWGAYFDYRLVNPTTPVTFTILDPQGTLMRRISSTERAPRIDASKLSIPAYWVKPGQTLSAEPGEHRYVWDLRYLNAGGPLLPPGAYTVQMSVSGQIYSQPLTIIPDPRVKTTVPEMRAQFAMILEVQEEIKVVGEALSKAQGLYRKSQGDKRAALAKLLGIGSDGHPIPHDVTSLRHVADGLGALEGAVRSGPAAPTPEYRLALANLKKRAAPFMTELASGK
jgi:photosystem II stability/assembly factor-like uncharacterized protein